MANKCDQEQGDVEMHSGHGNGPIRPGISKIKNIYIQIIICF